MISTASDGDIDRAHTAGPAAGSIPIGLSYQQCDGQGDGLGFGVGLGHGVRDGTGDGLGDALGDELEPGGMRMTGMCAPPPELLPPP